MPNDDAGKPNMVVFWKVVFPILTIILLLVVLFITFSLPDCALSDNCSSTLVRVQRAVQSSQPASV